MKEIFSQLRTKIRLDKEDLLGEGFQHMNYKKNSTVKKENLSVFTKKI